MDEIYLFTISHLLHCQLTLNHLILMCVGLFEQITSYWLPLIRQTGEEDSSKPVIIVGNKVV